MVMASKVNPDLDFPLLSDAISKAGGVKRISADIGVSRQSLHNWWRGGLPRTEYTGETEYVKALARMAAGRGEFVNIEDVLEETRAHLIKVARSDDPSASYPGWRSRKQATNEYKDMNRVQKELGIEPELEPGKRGPGRPKKNSTQQNV